MKVGMTSGCFDLFHHSHLLFLEACRSRCDKLIVGIDSNDLVSETKGDGRPIHDEMHRFNLVNSLQVVNMAFILRHVEDLTKMARDFNVTEVYKCEVWKDRGHVFGTEYARLIIIPDIPGMVSTTKIINRIRSGQLPILTREYEKKVEVQEKSMPSLQATKV